MALNKWATPDQPVTMVGDNSGSLQLSLDLNSTKTERSLLRELAWRKAVHHWVFCVAHLPTENNTIADLLSRHHETDPDLRVIPQLLDGAACVPVDPLGSLWSCI